MVDWRDARLVVLELLLKLGPCPTFKPVSRRAFFIPRYLTNAILVGAVSSTIRLSSDFDSLLANSDTAKMCFLV
jgi:hypothetical protein